MVLACVVTVFCRLVMVHGHQSHFHATVRVSLPSITVLVAVKFALTSALVPAVKVWGTVRLLAWVYHFLLAAVSRKPAIST